MVTRSQTLGPYTLDRRLGAGGMGEVYQAYDRRLERWVAIKLIRAEAAENATARERLRREARAAARLSHPSIVQIHDILESEEGDAIVMELVEGEPLSRCLARGPLPVEQAVRLGREVAEGLAAAHARGVLHRDLKADNVMITAEGRAKILDFGLAKRLEGEASLTEDHRVVGTFRSMSPEQAKGLPLDARSDLFSLGILFYEMLSGRSPFDGGSTLETLTRICSYRQTTLREIAPGIPPALSNLVDGLLAKDPVLRPQSALAAAAALRELSGRAFSSTDDRVTWSPETELAFMPRQPEAPPSVRAANGKASPRLGPVARRRVLLLGAILAVLAGVLAFWLMHRFRPPPLRVAILRPDLVAAARDSESIHRLGTGLRVALFRGLAALEGVYPLAPEQVDPVAGPPARVARATAADEVLTSKLDCGVAVCQLWLSRVAGQDGRVLWTQGIEVPVDKPYLMAEAVEGHLRLGYAGHEPRPDMAVEVRPEDYAAYLVLLDRYERRQREELGPEEAARLAAIRRSSPRFLDAFIFEASALQRRFQFRREPADLERAADLLRQARAIAPADPRPLEVLFEIAFKARRLGQAEEVLSDLEKLQPGSYELRMLRARLLEQQGRAPEALALIREAARRNPSWRTLYWAARMTYRNGQSAEGRWYLSELLARFPDYEIGKSLLGEWELLTGSPQEAVALYNDLIRRRQPDATELVQLGLAYLLLDQYARAEERFRHALALSPRNPLVALNLADVLWLRGNQREADDLYRGILGWIEQDPGRSQVQLLSARAQASAHLGRRREAVDAAQEMFRLAPDDPQVALDISLIYTLVGDQASALANARRALEGGVEPRWFEFPWFAPLRSSLDLEAPPGRP